MHRQDPLQEPLSGLLRYRKFHVLRVLLGQLLAPKFGPKFDPKVAPKVARPLRMRARQATLARLRAHWCEWAMNGFTAV